MTTHDDEVKSNEDSGTSGQPECQFNDVAMSPSMEYFVQVSQSYGSTQLKVIISITITDRDC